MQRRRTRRRRKRMMMMMMRMRGPRKRASLRLCLRGAINN
jgi:hypothetical protein